MLLLRSAGPRTVLILGTTALFLGVGITLLALTFSTAAAFFAGTALAGAGFGAAFQGAMRSVLPLAAPHERSGVLSLIFVVSYLAMGLPAVLAGFLAVYGGGVLITAREYGMAVMVLALVALHGVLAPHRRRSPAPQAPTSQPIAPPTGVLPALSSRMPEDPCRRVIPAASMRACSTETLRA